MGFDAESITIRIRAGVAGVPLAVSIRIVLMGIGDVWTVVVGVIHAVCIQVIWRMRERQPGPDEQEHDTEQNGGQGHLRGQGDPL